MISNMIESSKRSAFEADAKMVLKASELKMLEDDTFDPLIVNESNVKEIFNIDNSG